MACYVYINTAISCSNPVNIKMSLFSPEMPVAGHACIPLNKKLHHFRTTCLYVHNYSHPMLKVGETGVVNN